MTTTELLPIIISTIFLVVYIYFFLASNKKNIPLSIDKEIDLKSPDNNISADFDELITTNKLNENVTFFVNTIYKIRCNIDNSYADPYKISNINSILVKNMLQDSGSIQDFLFPIFNHLCESKNSLYTYFIGNFFESILIKKIASSKELSDNIKLYGSNNLKKTLFLHFLKAKVNYTELKNLILDLTEEDNTIENYSDILALSYFEEPERIICLLDEITPTYAFYNVGKLESKRELSILKLTIFFFVKVLVDSKGKIENTNSIKQLLFEKYKFILESIFGNSNNPISQKIKEKTYVYLEEAGIQQWRKAIGNIDTGREINNYFFVKYKKSKLSHNIQRDQLEYYFKYFIALFNETFSIKDENQFIIDSMEMIEFGKYSINGYLSCIALNVYVLQLGQNRQKAIDNIISQIITNPNDSNYFFLSIFIDNLLKTKNQTPEFYLHILSLSKKYVNPLIISGQLNFNPFYYLDNTFFETNSDEGIFSEMTNQFFTINSQEVINNITPKLAYISFLDNKIPSRYIATKIFELNMLDNKNWKECSLVFLATCFENDKGFIQSLLSKSNRSTSVNEWQLVNKTNKSILSLHFPRSYQIKWNEFIINGFIENRRIKYFLIHDLIGGLIQSNSVSEFSLEFRKFIIELTKSYYNESTIYNNSLSIEEVYQNTISKKDNSKTEVYSYE